jgi:ssDNA-binding Zn-finger/Zn-ribbon topoisomerase 1
VGSHVNYNCSVPQVYEVTLEENKVRSYLICPACSFPMVLFTSKEAKYPSGRPRKFYRCANIKQCEVVCGANPDGTPLGVPGNLDTVSARHKLHVVFDRLWLSGRWSRTEAYQILQILTGLEEEQAHIACFDEIQCDWVGKQIEEFLELNPHKDHRNGCHFVCVKKECAEHGLQVHKVYLEGRQEFCVNCLDQMKGPVWRSFLILARERSSRSL